MKGVLGLRSSTDPSCATVRFDRGRIAVATGIAEDASVVVTMNPDDPSEKPKVTGAARHPLFAMNLAKVMEPPTGAWQEEAASFWTFAAPSPRMPDRLKVVCTDDGSELVLGSNGDGSVYEVHGSAEMLAALFSGSSVLGQAALEGKVKVVGTLEHASVMTGRFIAWAFGEGR